MEIERRMNVEGHQCACLTGEYTPQDRDIVIDAFREGRMKVLITTNVLARGIDIQSVSLVVNYVSARPPMFPSGSSTPQPSQRSGGQYQDTGR